jgi:hypothetical protein
MEQEQEQEQEENWSSIDLSKDSTEADKVEFEIEGEQDEEVVQEAAPVTVLKKQKDQDEVQEEQPEELEGVETKGAQKRIRQLIRQRKERDEELGRLRDEVGSLRNSVKERDTQLSSSLKNTIDSTESKLETTLNNAREVYKQAAENGDAERMLSAQESMSKTYAEMTQVHQQRRAWEDYNEQVKRSLEVQQEQAQKQPPQYDPKAVDWATKNPWFGQDQIMTAAALTLDQEIKNEGYDPSDDDFYEEIDVRLRLKYPHKFQTEQAVVQTEAPRLRDTPSNSAQVVAGSSRTPKTSNSKNRVKLTQEDVRLANKWGITLEKYAQEKLKVEQADGEYTSI